MTQPLAATIQPVQPAPAAPPPQYSPAEPLLATVVENRRLTQADNPSDVRHIVLRWPAGALQFAEGQAVGVAPPGLNRRGRPHPPRLFSLASARDGELGDDAGAALTVKRFFGQDPQSGAAIPGLASHFLCDSRPGDAIGLSGPIGDLLTLPAQAEGPLLLFATGTGIAPMRGLLQRRARSPQQQQHAAVLLHGAPTDDDLAYRGEFAAQAQADPHFAYLTARSRQQQDRHGGRLYVGALALAHAELIGPLLQHPRAQVLVCGVRGMEDGVEAALVELGGAALLQRLKAEGRLRLEVY